MLSSQHLLIFLALAIIIFFLLKAFVGNKLSNIQIVLIILAIMLIVIFISGQDIGCRRKKSAEKYQSVDNKLSTFKSNYDILVTEEENDDPNEFNQPNQTNQPNQCPNIVASTINPKPKNTGKNSDPYGYTYLSPKLWYQDYDTVPICITNERCRTCPMVEPLTNGLLEVDFSTN